MPGPAETAKNGGGWGMRVVSSTVRQVGTAQYCGFSNKSYRRKSRLEHSGAIAPRILVGVSTAQHDQSAFMSRPSPPQSLQLDLTAVLSSYLYVHPRAMGESEYRHEKVGPGIHSERGCQIGTSSQELVLLESRLGSEEENIVGPDFPRTRT